MDAALVSVARGVVLGADDQTTSLLRSSVHRLDNVYQFLFIFEDPVELVIVSGTEIDHHVFVAEEEHDCARVVQFCSNKLASAVSARH